MNSLRQRFIRYWRQIAGPGLPPSGLAIADIQAQCRKMSEHILAQLSLDEGRKYSGYHNSNKGLRQGLIAAKECIKRTNPNWVMITGTAKVGRDKLLLLQMITNQLTTKHLQPTLSRKTRCCLQCFINETQEQTKSLLLSETSKLNQTLCLNTFISDKRCFINSISNGIKQHLSQQRLDDAQINSQLVALIQDPSNHYLHFTSLMLEPNPRAFVQQAIINIEKQKSIFNSLPGDEGTYELSGLASAISWLHHWLYSNSQSVSANLIQEHK